MSVLQLQRSDAQSDDKLDLRPEEDWSRMRSAHSEREIFSYSVKSDSGQVYESEVFISDLGTICGFCNCLASELGKRQCRHVKAVLADTLQRVPTFGEKVFKQGESGNETVIGLRAKP